MRKKKLDVVEIYSWIKNILEYILNCKMRLPEYRYQKRIISLKKVVYKRTVVLIVFFFLNIAKICKDDHI